MPDNVVSRLSHRSRTQLLYVASNQVQCCNAYLELLAQVPLKEILSKAESGALIGLLSMCMESIDLVYVDLY
jgi:hypothetical protein